MNHISEVIVQDHNLTPAAAEVRVTVVAQRQDAGTEVRGRLMGPRCAYATTIEVAYPLRPFGPATPAAPLTRRALIPEPSFWEPESPFLYEGPVELWQDGTRCEQRTIRHGLRSVTLGGRGLRLNGRPLQLRGCERACSAEDIADLRGQGLNLVVAEAEAALCEAADRLGLFVLVRRQTLPDLAEVRRVTAHACSLGWLFSLEAALQGPLPSEGLIGIELDQPPVRPLPSGVHFIVAGAEHAAALASPGLAFLLRGAPKEVEGGAVLGRLTE